MFEGHDSRGFREIESLATRRTLIMYSVVGKQVVKYSVGFHTEPANSTAAVQRVPKVACKPNRLGSVQAGLVCGQLSIPAFQFALLHWGHWGQELENRLKLNVSTSQGHIGCLSHTCRQVLSVP